MEVGFKLARGAVVVALVALVARPRRAVVFVRKYGTGGRTD